ncbi:malto-oligosyltrehalose synthase [Gordonia sp. (in: high G+C Gram-positive bacteria)]|uniref:malto-oligosyltrehalose synthase n=1 Tax=Gordonia sp. (in: high G+C Gram-positive bacteria) TaxID=84139 RepID=UPI00260B46E1|nr:malto-oligosyltrehalose synthase [Gordonia sp. (in: high G+C Gram-positive bacteria)]
MSDIPIEPIATYRVQLTPEFAFAEVVGILDQLADLGISHLYLSPILGAMPGSTHGYDWTPPTQISAELGGIDGFRLLRAHARAVGIGLIIDIVPNHVGIAVPARNAWWADVLRFGMESRYAGYFDLHPASTDGVDGRILLPFLGAGQDLEELRLDDDGNLCLHDWVLPTAPDTAAPGDDPVEVLGRQHYRLVAATSPLLSYRRFLDIGELAALRVEAPEVFEATHGWLRYLANEDLIDGVRVDHLDGLRDPLGYTTALREILGPHRLIYVEKGLAVDEQLDDALPIDGTTGYDQLQLIEAAFTSPPGIIELDEIFRWITGLPGDGDQLAAQARALRDSTMRTVFATRLRWASAAVAEATPSVPLFQIEQAVAAFVVALTVSRPDYPQLLPRVLATIEAARSELPTASVGLDSVAAVFLAPDEYPEAVFRVSELATAVAAKAIEDVGFHRTARLISTQELGCNPRVPTISPVAFHERNRVRARTWPLALTTVSTHDTKRSGDARARIALIAQVPQRWNLLVHRIWQEAPPPHPRTAYLLLQNVIGVWPDDGSPDADLRERLARYATRAMRDAALITSWPAPNDDAEEQTQTWLAAVLTGTPAALISEFVGLIHGPGRCEALARTAVALLGPGVPDVYQGSQWWDHSLTDPDNRRPVDYTQPADHQKFTLITEALAVRRRYPEAFGTCGEYREVTARGARAGHILAFARGPADRAPQVVVVTERFSQTFRPGPDREEAAVDLPPGRWRDVRTGVVQTGRTRADRLLGDRPVAILEATDD